MRPTPNQAETPGLQEVRSVDRRRGRDLGVSAPSMLTGWILWAYLGALLAALLALIGPPVFRALRATWGAL